jgi:hypothetical protein
LTVIDFAARYNVDPLYQQGITGKGRTAIRAHMEELRRERAQMSAARDPLPLCPRADGRQQRFLACNSSNSLRRN